MSGRTGYLGGDLLTAATDGPAVYRFGRSGAPPARVRTTGIERGDRATVLAGGPASSRLRGAQSGIIDSKAVKGADTVGGHTRAVRGL